ncbi:MAG: cysteine hydrolase [Candidatus Eremiobacteraeota bacterium]|nr:cysteine hydrolase [Candidatus Eremiobacteraeota bacterium]
MTPPLPTRANVAVIFLDLQSEIVALGRTVPLPRLRLRAGVLAKLAALHALPAFASSVPPGGEFLSDVLDGLPTLRPRPRTQTSAFADAGLVDQLRASGRTILVLSGVATEIVVQRTALDALEAGFNVHVAVDACGGVDPRTEEAAWRRIVQAGGVTSSSTTLSAELTGDFTSEIGGRTLNLVYETLAP